MRRLSPSLPLFLSLSFTNKPIHTRKPTHPHTHTHKITHSHSHSQTSVGINKKNSEELKTQLSEFPLLILQLNKRKAIHSPLIFSPFFAKEIRFIFNFGHILKVGGHTLRIGCIRKSHTYKVFAFTYQDERERERKRERE